MLFADKMGIQKSMEYFWSAFGVLLKYFWSAFGLLWRAIGLQWSTFGVLLD